MPITSRAIFKRTELDEEIKSVLSKLGPEVVHTAYRLREDSTGEPAIFIRIVLADEATREDIFFANTRRIVSAIWDELNPVDNWGLFAYVNFRSQTEHQNRQGRDWE